MDLQSIGHALSVWLIPVVVAITFHEAAHGWVAERCGDRTARLMGRVTFNPIKHVDPIGTLLVPGILLAASLLSGSPPFLFGWAKPVPVAFHRLNHPKRDMIWVALAGPGINLVLATAAAFAVHLLPYAPESVAFWLADNLRNFIIINLILAIFNMLPLPPLDGGRVVTGLLPGRLAWNFARLEPFGIPILLGVIFLVPYVAGRMGYQFNPLLEVIWPVFIVVYEGILNLAGLR